MKENGDKELKKEKQLRCGVIMPISAIEGYSENHWSEMREILYDTIETAGFEPNLVSDADDVGIIQKRIIQNIYENPIMVCDVSGKNPNVMFELGLRLAFDKPTIIIKDNITSYSFDTSPIEHLVYPKDLRFNQIVDFKNELVEKIRGTYKRSIEDPSYTTFLKHFGSFSIAKIDTKEIPTSEFILEELQSLRKAISEMGVLQQANTSNTTKESKLVLCLQRSSSQQNDTILSLINKYGDFSLVKKSIHHFHFVATNPSLVDWKQVLKLAKTVNSTARLLNV